MDTNRVFIGNSMRKIAAALLAACMGCGIAHAEANWISIGKAVNGHWYIAAGSVRPIGDSGASFWSKIDVEPGYRSPANAVSTLQHINATCGGDTVTVTSSADFDNAGRMVHQSTVPETYPATPGSSYELLVTDVCGALHPGKY